MKPIRLCRPFGTQRNLLPLTPAMNRWAVFTASWREALLLLTAYRSLFALSLLSAFCLLLTAFTPSLTVGLLPRVFSQSEFTQPAGQPTPSASPAASPVPSPTPPPNLHQWGAVTSFHGLPSDRTHEIVQTEL